MGADKPSMYSRILKYPYGFFKHHMEIAAEGDDEEKTQQSSQ